MTECVARAFQGWPGAITVSVGEHVLREIGDLPSLTGQWLPSSSRAAGAGLVTFTSTADLTPAAKSGPERSSQYLGTG